MADISNEQNLILKVQSKIKDLKKTVFDKRVICELTHSDRSFRVRLGYGKDGKQIVRRIGSDPIFAAKFKEQWNKSIAEKDHVLAESLYDLTSLSVRRALVKLRDFHGISLEMCVDYYIQNALPFQGKVSVMEAMDIYLEIQQKKNLKETSYSKTHSNYRTYFKPFAAFFGNVDLTFLSPAKVESYFQNRGKAWNPKSWNEHRSRLIGFWNILAKHKYCSLSTNPFEQIVKKQENRKRNSEKVSKPDVARQFFHWLEEECIKYPSKVPELALSIITWFCGIRIKEVTRVDWGGINQNAEHLGALERKDYSGWAITVWGDQEKTSTDKINPIPKNAQLWLKFCSKIGTNLNGTIAEKDHAQRMTKLRGKFNRKTNISFCQNTARHSWASHHLALYGDKVLTAERLGHGENPDTLERSYKAGMSPHEAKKYFAIIPKSEENKLTNLYLNKLKENLEILESIGPTGNEQAYIKEQADYQHDIAEIENGIPSLELCANLIENSNS